MNLTPIAESLKARCSPAARSKRGMKSGWTGQPSIRREAASTLGGVRVLEVHERGDEVVHLCSGPLEPGTLVRGEIDWERRFDLMQNHSGEHIVSGFAHARWGCNNVGFHMGSDVITIDFDVVLQEEDLRWLEDVTNRYIWEDHPVLITYPAPEELSALNYRSKKELTGQVRIVTFPDADVCACCGTHVSSTGQIGLVRLLGVQKFREGVRIELLCGARAMAHMVRISEQNAQVSHLLSAKPHETGKAVERLLEERDGLKLRLQEFEERDIARLSEQCANAGDVILFTEGMVPDTLRRLCDAALHVCGGMCACFSGSDGEGYKYAIGAQEGDLRSFTKDLNRALHGRGGGRNAFVQGSVQASRVDITAYLNSLQKWAILG